jgi:hypothetical protein
MQQTASYSRFRRRAVAKCVGHIDAEQSRHLRVDDELRFGHDAGVELELRFAENSVLGGVLPPPASAAAQDINAP